MSGLEEPPPHDADASISRSDPSNASEPHGEQVRQPGALAAPRARNGGSGGVPSRRPHVSSQPHTAEAVREQLTWECNNVSVRKERHENRADRWDAIAAWTRGIVTLTAGISALSIVTDNLVLATVFSITTAVVAAINAAVEPPETAKKHRQAARAYGRLERPLGELLFKFESYYEPEYVPQTGYDPVSQTHYDAGYYRATGRGPTVEDLTEMWSDFRAIREKIEEIDERAPSLRIRHAGKSTRALLPWQR